MRISNLGNHIERSWQITRSRIIILAKQLKLILISQKHIQSWKLLKDLGKLKEAELSTRKAIEINPNFAIWEAIFNLGNYID